AVDPWTQCGLHAAAARSTAILAGRSRRSRSIRSHRRGTAARRHRQAVEGPRLRRRAANVRARETRSEQRAADDHRPRRASPLAPRLIAQASSPEAAAAKVIAASADLANLRRAAYEQSQNFGYAQAAARLIEVYLSS